MIKVLSLKIVIKQEYQDITFSEKFTLQVGLIKFLSLKKLEILSHGHT